MMLPARARPRGVSSTISVPSPCEAGYGLQRVVAGIYEWLVVVRLRGMRRGNHQSHGDHFFDCDADRQRAVDFHALDLGNFAVFFERPKFFEHFVELLFVGHGKHFLRCDLAVMEFDAAVGQARHHRVVRDHHDGAPLLMKLAQQAQNDFFVDRIEVAGGFVGQDDLGIVDQGARDADPLLLPA